MKDFFLGRLVDLKLIRRVGLKVALSVLHHLCSSDENSCLARLKVFFHFWRPKATDLLKAEFP